MEQQDQRSSTMWTLQGSFSNDTNHEVSMQLPYNVGVTKGKKYSVEISERSLYEAAASLAQTTELSSVRPKTELTARATCKITESQGKAETQVSSDEQISSKVKTLDLKVSPYEKIFLWQLVCRDGDVVTNLPTYTLSNDPNPPTEMRPSSHPLAASLTRACISPGMLFRLKHMEMNQYLNTIKRIGWEAATLGESREVYFRIEPHSDKRHIRILIENPMFEEYNCLYSTDNGGIYFDKRTDASIDKNKQLWEMSMACPSDGDIVTFRNGHWSSSGLVHHEGPDTNVYCKRRHALDKWVMEVVCDTDSNGSHDLRE